jgi:hypothetical protein
MPPQIFEAIVQYNDLAGSVVADYSDYDGFDQWLDERGLKNSNEQVWGIQLRAGGNGKPENLADVRFLLLPLGMSIDTVDNLINSGNPLQVKVIDEKMTFPEFFNFFKRFNLTLSPNKSKQTRIGAELDGILQDETYL